MSSANLAAFVRTGGEALTAPATVYGLVADGDITGGQTITIAGQNGISAAVINAGRFRPTSTSAATKASFGAAPGNQTLSGRSPAAAESRCRSPTAGPSI